MHGENHREQRWTSVPVGLTTDTLFNIVDQNCIGYNYIGYNRSGHDNVAFGSK
jgi:hypothetical protein